MGEFWGRNISSNIDSKRLKNNLQGFKDNLYPQRYRGVGQGLGGTVQGPRIRKAPALWLFVHLLCAR